MPMIEEDRNGRAQPYYAPKPKKPKVYASTHERDRAQTGSSNPERRGNSTPTPPKKKPKSSLEANRSRTGRSTPRQPLGPQLPPRSIPSTWTGRLTDYGYPMGSSGGRAFQAQIATMGLTPETYDALMAIQAYMKARGMAVRASDTFRSYAAQEELRRRKPTLATMPGNSIHGTGRAFDLENYDGRPLSQQQVAALDAYAPNAGVWNPRRADENWHFQLRPDREYGRSNVNTVQADPYYAYRNRYGY